MESRSEHNQLDSDLAPENVHDKPPRIFHLQISAEEQEALTKKFEFDKPRERSYVYFDTSADSEHAMLFKNKVQLRIKTKGLVHTLELKTRGNVKNEVEDTLSAEEFQALLEGVFPDGKVKDTLSEQNLFFPVKPIDSSISVRRGLAFHGGKLTLDQTTINHRPEANYTLEFHSKGTFSDGEIQALLEELGVSNNPVKKNKLEKFWEGR